MTASTDLKQESAFASKAFTTRQGRKTPFNKQGDRTMTSSHLLGTTTEDGAEHVVEVSTHHSTEGKYFFSTARLVTKKSENGFDITTYDLFGGPQVSLGKVPVARYSAKALAEVHQEAMRDLAYLYGRGNARALSVFNEYDQEA